MSSLKRIFITGGTGFIGKHLIKELSKTGHEIFALSRKDIIDNHNSSVRYIKGDIFEPEKWVEYLKNTDIFIHSAGEKTIIKDMSKVNVLGFQIVLSEISKFPEIKLVFISTSGVYGIYNNPEKILDESSACYPDNEYERTKYLSEKILIDSSSNFTNKYVILRPSNVLW
jgi:nucleoside-diphosphate-sugar epimerase